MNSPWVLFDLSAEAVPIITLKRKHFNDLYYDRGFVWQAIRSELSVICLYEMIPYDDLGTGTITLTDNKGRTKQFLRKEIRIACKLPP
jgi:hypothetical protein